MTVEETATPEEIMAWPCVFPSMPPYLLSSVDTSLLFLPCSLWPLLLSTCAFPPVRHNAFISSSIQLDLKITSKWNSFQVTSFVSSDASADLDSRSLKSLWVSSSWHFWSFLCSSCFPLICTKKQLSTLQTNLLEISYIHTNKCEVKKKNIILYQSLKLTGFSDLLFNLLLKQFILKVKIKYYSMNYKLLLFFNCSPTDLLLVVQSCIHMLSKIEELKIKQLYASEKKYQPWLSKEFDLRYLCLHSFDFFLFFRYFILEMFKLHRVEKNIV